MSQLINKSEINFGSAQFLQKQDYYCSTVHCAYYSCVQLMRHILVFKIGKTETEIKEEARITKGGSHVYMIDTVFTYLVKINNKDYNTFNTNIVSLKKLRGKSDYEDFMINFDEGRKSIALAESINKILKKLI